MKKFLFLESKHICEIFSKIGNLFKGGKAQRKTETGKKSCSPQN